MALIFYDMKCGFCTSSISWIQQKNNKGNMLFFDLSEIKNLSLNQKDSLLLLNTNSIILIENSEVFIYADAVIRILKLTGGIYKVIAFIIQIIPSFIRNSLYRIIARNRYCLSGLV